MNRRFNYRKVLLIATVLCLAPFLSAQDGLKGALSQASFGAPLGHGSLAIADLDGDHEADGAVFLDSKWTGTRQSINIQLHFTGRSNSEINFESGVQLLTIHAWDIDHDGDNDLVVEEAITHKPVSVWINEGNGDFHEGNVQDYPSLALGADQKVHLPSNERDSLPLWAPSQRNFEISLLTVQLLGRPPSHDAFLLIPANLPAMCNARGAQSSRAPPLFS